MEHIKYMTISFKEGVPTSSELFREFNDCNGWVNWYEAAHKDDVGAYCIKAYAFKGTDLEPMGGWMNKAHKNLRHDYLKQINREVK